jgi:ribosomal protein S18 acetylase RimI-like enzyme
VAPWRIRRATAADAPALSEVLLEAGRAAWGGFLGADRIERANRGREHPADLVVEDEDGLFAFVAWDADTGEILRLYTHPRAWGAGAGQALLDEALGVLRAAGHDQAWLNTEERNQIAIRFYERLGWRRDGAVREREWNGARLREPRFVKDL